MSSCLFLADLPEGLREGRSFASFVGMILLCDGDRRPDAIGSSPVLPLGKRIPRQKSLPDALLSESRAFLRPNSVGHLSRWVFSDDLILAQTSLPVQVAPLESINMSVSKKGGNLVGWGNLP